jgi:hypothetical protein
MTNEQKKLLTEWLGEPWPSDKAPLHKCIMRRTFAAPDDFFAVFDKLVEKGEWGRFYYWAEIEWAETDYTPISGFSATFNKWLNSCTESGHYRLCQLTANYLKEKEKNNG